MKPLYLLLLWCNINKTLSEDFTSKYFDVKSSPAFNQLSCIQFLGNYHLSWFIWAVMNPIWMVKNWDFKNIGIFVYFVGFLNIGWRTIAKSNYYQLQAQNHYFLIQPGSLAVLKALIGLRIADWLLKPFFYPFHTDRTWSYVQEAII